MQLIARHEIADYDRWKAAFDNHAEARGAAGLSVLQIWREDGAPRVLILYAVSDRARAEAALARLDALMAERAGVAASDYTFLRLA